MSIYIIDPELKRNFLVQLERDGILNKEEMRLDLNLSSKTDVEKILAELLSEGLVEEGSGEDTGEIQMSEKGQEYLHGKNEDEPLEYQVTVESLTKVLGYVANSRSVPMTFLDHQLMQKRLRLSAAELEYNIKSLLGQFMEEVDGQLRITEVGLKCAMGELAIELPDNADSQIECGDKEIVVDDSVSWYDKETRQRVGSISSLMAKYQGEKENGQG